VAFLIFLVAVGVVLFRVTSPEERSRHLQRAKASLRDLWEAATVVPPALDSFHQALRARTRHVFVVPAIVAVNVVVLAGMIVGAGAMADAATRVGWGANLGTRTTNGEWWRLLTSAFVHTGTFQLLVDAFVLIQLGSVLERMIGRLAVGAVYLSAAALAGLAHLSAHPVAIGIGTSASVFSLYGLFVATLGWQALSRWQAAPKPDPESIATETANETADETADEVAEQDARQHVTIPLIAVKRIGIVAALFLAIKAVDGHATATELSGLAVGFAYGLALGRSVSTRTPGTRAAGLAMAASAVIAAILAMPLRNIADVKPELARVIVAEEHTAGVYKAALDRFKHGRMTAEALAQLAEQTIVPELQAADARLQALQHVPHEHQPFVTDAREFLRLRCASWRVRADATRASSKGLHRPDGEADARWRLQAEAQHRSNLTVSGKAEGAERGALEAFERVKHAASASDD
jgi:membrane associated rhomboid family serine protease